MSHFTVLVAVRPGEDLEDLLEPYNENTLVDPYWEGDDIDFERRYYSDPEHVDDPMPADATLAEAVEWLNANTDEGPYRVDPDDPTKTQRQTTYNPDSKWDYWRVGGRWAGRLPLKPGATGHREPLSWEWKDAKEDELPEDDRVDTALKRDVDIECARQQAEEGARETWAIWQAIVAKHGVPKTFEQIAAELTDAEGNVDYDRVRETYWAQPAIQTAKGADLLSMWGSGIQAYTAHTEETFVENARLGAICGYAFLSSGTGWLEPGRVGCFGSSNGTPDSELAYRRQVGEALDAMPDDTTLVIVDCHI